MIRPQRMLGGFQDLPEIDPRVLFKSILGLGELDVPRMHLIETAASQVPGFKWTLECSTTAGSRGEYTVRWPLVVEYQLPDGGAVRICIPRIRDGQEVVVFGTRPPEDNAGVLEIEHLISVFAARISSAWQQCYAQRV